MAIHFFFIDQKIVLKDRTTLKRSINQMIEKEGFKQKNLTYVFCSDQYLLKLNKRYLKHNYYTDILTFALSSEKKEIDGEIYISVNRVKENAKSLKLTFKQELYRVIFHGALHLCGYNDKSEPEIKEMRKKENKYLEHIFNVSRGTLKF